MALLGEIRRKVGENCIVRTLKKSGCKVKLTEAPTPRLIIDCDKLVLPIQKSSTRCDYLIVTGSQSAGLRARAARGGDKWIIALELKRGRLDASKVVDQLRAGAAIAEQLVAKKATGGRRFRPIAVSGSRKKYERDELKKRANRIRFLGRSRRIRVISYGEALIKGLRR